MTRTWIRSALVLVALTLAPSLAEAKMAVQFGPTELDPAVKDLARALIAPAEFVEVALPVVRNVPLSFEDCGQRNAFYDPDQRRITVCYELVWYLAQSAIKIFSDAEQAELGTEIVHDAYHLAMLYAFFHEVAHAYIHLSDRDVTGSEEDVADQLATFLMWSLDLETVSMLGGLVFFEIDEHTDLDIWDEHSPDKRRLANLACWSYGAEPEGVEELFKTVGSALGDPEGMERRQARCGQEWAKIKKVWSKVVKGTKTAP